MAEKKIQFDDKDQLTPESQKEIEKQADNLVSTVDTNIEEIIGDLESDETDVFSDKFLDKIYEKLNLSEISKEIQGNLDKEAQIKTLAVFELLKNIYKKLSVAEKTEIDKTEFKPDDLNSFNFKKIDDYKKAFEGIITLGNTEIFSRIIESFSNDIASLETLKTNATSNSLETPDVDITKKINDIKKIHDEISQMPEGNKKEKLLKEIDNIKKEYEEVNKKLIKIPSDAPKDLETIKDNYTTFEKDLTELIKHIGDDRNGPDSYALIKNKVDSLIALQEKNLLITDKIKSKLKSPPLKISDFKKLKTEIDNIKNAEEKLNEIKNIKGKYEIKGSLSKVDKDALKQELINILSIKIGTEDWKKEITKLSETFVKLFPKTEILSNLQDYSKLKKLNKTLKSLHSKLFGVGVKTGDRLNYSYSSKYIKSLNHKNILAQESEKDKKLLDDLENTFNDEKTQILTDQDILDNVYGQYIKDGKIKDPEFVKTLKETVDEIARLANAKKKPIHPDFKNLNFIDKIKEINKVTEEIGEANISPSLREKLNHLKNSPSNPEENLKKLKEKTNKIEELKKKLIDEKNLDILNPEIATVQEEIRKTFNELHELEDNIFGAKIAYEIKKEIKEKRKEMEGRVKIDKGGIKGEGEIKTFLERLEAEIKITKDAVDNLGKKIEDESLTEEERDENREAYNQKYKTLIHLEELQKKKLLELDRYMLSKPEKINGSTDVFLQLVENRDNAKFKNKRLVRDRLRRGGLAINPFKALDQWREARNTSKMNDTLNKQLELLIETGFSGEKIEGTLDKAKHPINTLWQYLFKKSIERRQELIKGARDRNEGRYSPHIERDKRVTEKIKGKYETLKDQEAIWQSTNIQESIKIYKKMQKMLLDNKGKSSEFENLSNRLKELMKGTEEADKSLLVLITPKYDWGTKTAEEKTKEIKEESDKMQEIEEKRLQDILTKFRSINPEKYYPDFDSRSQIDKNKWQEITKYVHLPERFEINTLKPFLQFIKLHQKTAKYIFDPRDILRLIKMQNANILNHNCPLTKSEHFKKDFDFLKNDKKIKTIREYLDYRENHPVALAA